MDRIQLARIEVRLLAERDGAVRTLRRLDRETAETPDGPWSARFDPGEPCAEAMERESALALVCHASAVVDRVDAALLRLYTHPETFGRCAACGAEIDFDRPGAGPEGRWCAECTFLRDLGC